MKMISKYMTAPSVLVIALGVTPAMADCHGDWDTNSDATLDQTEFGTANDQGGWFGNADTDTSGSLSSDEVGTGLYGGLRP